MALAVKTRAGRHRFAPSARKRYKYLGKRVRDVGKPGLDQPREFLGILRSIIKDYKEGVISYMKARGRLLLLYRLTMPEKNRKVAWWPEKIRARIQAKILKALRTLRKLK